MTTSPRVLIVDDDAEIRQLLCDYLADYGMEASGASNGEELRSALGRERFDIVLLDLMLPGEDGLVLCRYLRSRVDIPIVIITGRGEISDRIVGLELGADDYVVKPFDERELIARINSVLRRSRRQQSKHEGTITQLVFGAWRLDTVLRQLIDTDGVVIPLSNAEFRLLMAFLDRPRRVLSRDTLISLARGTTVEVFDRSIDILVSRLRQKLRENPKEPCLIRTIRGEGYLFDCEVQR